MKRCLMQVAIKKLNGHMKKSIEWLCQEYINGMAEKHP
jgi:hypothetical protein